MLDYNFLYMQGKAASRRATVSGSQRRKFADNEDYECAEKHSGSTHDGG